MTTAQLKSFAAIVLRIRCVPDVQLIDGQIRFEACGLLFIVRADGKIDSKSVSKL